MLILKTLGQGMTEKRKPGRPRGKRSNKAYTQVCGYVKLTTYKQVRKLLIDEEKEFSELMQELLEQWITLKQNLPNDAQE